jgi:hypothetical protein
LGKEADESGAPFYARNEKKKKAIKEAEKK